MSRNFLQSLLFASVNLIKRAARTSMPLVACTLAASALGAPPASAPVIRPPTTLSPQTAMQAIQSPQRAGTEVVVGGQSMGYYKVTGSLPGVMAPATAPVQNPLARPRPTEIVLQATQSAPQMKYWFDWYQSVVQGKPILRDAQIIAHDAAGRAVSTWTLTKAWPTKVSTTPLAGQSNAFNVSISLVYEAIAKSQ